MRDPTVWAAILLLVPSLPIFPPVAFYMQPLSTVAGTCWDRLKIKLKSFAALVYWLIVPPCGVTCYKLLSRDVAMGR